MRQDKAQPGAAQLLHRCCAAPRCAAPRPPQPPPCGGTKRKGATSASKVWLGGSCGRCGQTTAIWKDPRMQPPGVSTSVPLRPEGATGAEGNEAGVSSLHGGTEGAGAGPCYDGCCRPSTQGSGGAAYGGRLPSRAPAHGMPRSQAPEQDLCL